MKLLIRCLIIIFPIIISAQSSNWRTGTNVELDFKPVPQTQTLWCWASCMAMVINFYDDENLSSCEIASKTFDFNCCNSPSSCNTDYSMFGFKKILEPYGIYPKNTQGKVSLNQIINEIDNSNPVLLRVEGKFGGHFIIIYGYYTRVNHSNTKKNYGFHVYDPMDGYFTDIYARQISWKRLLQSYGNDMHWTHTLRFNYWE